MKLNNIHFNRALWSLIAGILLLYGCGEREEDLQAPRLFMPVLQKDLSSIDNKIVVNMGDMKSAASYTIEVSRDTFKTDPIMTVKIDTNYVVLENDFLWNTIYQVRAQAHVPESSSMKDSKVSLLGNVRTQKYPSILNVPPNYYATDNRALVTWVNVGEPVTKIKVFAPTDERLQNPLMEFDVTEEDRGDLRFIVTGLDPLTPYQVAAYSETIEGEKLRGYEHYFTQEALPSGPTVFDLSGLEGTALVEALSNPDVPGGSTIILERGVTYPADGFSFNKSVLVRSGYGFVPQNPVIECSSNFNLENLITVESIVFQGITFTGDFASNYVFNIDQGGSIGELKFDNCRIRSLRGVLRMKGGEGNLENFTIINSVVDSINGYGIIAVDKDTWTVGNILLQNSTFAKTQYFLISRTNTKSVSIIDCTIMQAPEAGRQLLRWRGADGNNNVTNGVIIHNTIIGPGWDMKEEGNFGIDGFDGLGNTTFDVVNTYVTSDFSIASGKDEIAGFTLYNKTAEALWVDPYEDLDFSIKDSGFAGKNSAGDPRWRPGL